MMDRDLVYFAPHGWDTIRQRAQQLTLALATNHRVLYVDPVAPSLPGNVRRVLRGEPTRPWRGGLRQRAENVWTYTAPPLLPLALDLATVNSVSHNLIAPQIEQALDRLGFGQPTVVVGWPPAVAWASRFHETALVYDCMDDFPAFPQPARRSRLLEVYEQRLCERVAFITATSEQLAAKWQARHPHVHLLPNAVPDAFLSPARGSEPPADLAAIPGPRLLYIGMIGPWLDDALLAQAACIHLDWSFVLIGPVDTDIRTLQRLPNVHFLGARPHDSLPGYLTGADACLIPFKLSPLTTAVNPVKLYEYLAAGKPVVSTALPEVARYGALCYVAAEGVSFLRAAERAIAEGVNERLSEERRAIAAANTWSQRATAFDQLLATHIPDSNS